MYSVRIELEGNGNRKGRSIRIEDEKTAYEFFEMLKAVSDVMLAEGKNDKA